MIHVEEHLRGVAAPANLRINDQINAFRAACLENRLQPSLLPLRIRAVPVLPASHGRRGAAPARRAKKVFVSSG